MSLSPTDRKAILLLVGLAVAGQGVRAFLLRPGEAPGGIELISDAAEPGSPLAHRDSILRLARPLAAGERVNLDRATAAEIARIPRIGPRLAKAIVSDRDARGPFGSLEGLDRVSGVGPGLLAAIGNHVTFDAARIEGDIGRIPLPAPTPGGFPAAGAQPVDLNSATVNDLDRLPGIGPARARAIVAYRDAHGSFRATDDLRNVPGLPPSAVGRILPHVTVR